MFAARSHLLAFGPQSARSVIVPLRYGVGLSVALSTWSLFGPVAACAGSNDEFTVVSAEDLVSGTRPIDLANHLAKQASDVPMAGTIDDPDAPEGDMSKQDDLFLDTVLRMMGPVAAKFGFGGMLGYCTGYALKQASKVAMLMIGASVVGLQVLQYVGYVEVKWAKIQSDVVGKIDSDKSGKIGFKDFKHYTKRLFAILRHNGPTAGGYSTGIYLGFYRG